PHRSLTDARKNVDLIHREVNNMALSRGQDDAFLIFEDRSQDHAVAFIEASEHPSRFRGGSSKWGQRRPQRLTLSGHDQQVWSRRIRLFAFFLLLWRAGLRKVAQRPEL